MRCKMLYGVMSAAKLVAPLWKRRAALFGTMATGAVPICADHLTASARCDVDPAGGRRCARGSASSEALVTSTAIDPGQAPLATAGPPADLRCLALR